jgi:predicted nucleic acid-binding protein
VTEPLALLDTSALLQLPQWFDSRIRSFAASTVARAELVLAREVRRLRGEEGEALKRELLISALDGAKIWIPFESGDAETYGTALAALLPVAPAEVRSRDALIAATALRLKVPVVTWNIKDFERFGVEALNPPDAIIRFGA